MNIPATEQRGVLIVDDNHDVRLALNLLLRSEGLSTHLAASPAAAMDAASRQLFSCAIVDMNYSADTTSGHEGVHLVAQLSQQCPGLPILVLTAWGSIDLAVHAMRAGAADFIEKPWVNARLLHTVRVQIGVHDMRQENDRLRGEAMLAREPGLPLCITESPRMRQVLALVARVAAGRENILLQGENGTGKSIVARDIHARSPRTGQPLIRVDMGSLAEARFGEELFGEEAASRPGRFELAHGGTVVLEEVSCIPLAQQVKLLRVLEDGELERVGSGQTRRVDARVISTTSANLDAASRNGRFRSDLLYRLNVLQVRLPSLRERPEDIIPLARHFLLHECQRLRLPAARFSVLAERAMRAHDWPGNIRELEHAVLRAVVAGQGREIEASALAIGSRADVPQALQGLTLEEAEDLLIDHHMANTGQNLQRTAGALGISRQSLYRRLDRRRHRRSDDAAG